ncbi:MAG TPA: pyridoxal-phosphate dependent enzyme, partial [Bacteroidetes bacterium]|nr:pyridoxal-phosphate dependent enzyme [Bacteroidota bacterium]
SYKIRGAYHKMCKLEEWKKGLGVICASAGNHAQGVAYSCSLLKIFGHIYMPVTTPKQKVDKVRRFGGEWVKIYLEGDSFEQANEVALKIARECNCTFVHPFDDEDVMLRMR